MESSNSSIIKKLNIEKHNRKALLNKPVDVLEFESLNFDTNIKSEKYDLIFAFIFSLNEFTKLLKTVIDNDNLNPEGVLYFAYPKKGNKQYKEYIGRDDFFEVIDMNNEGYVYDSFIKFNKMAAFSEVFTVIGLKHTEKRKKSNAPSQCVADYVDRIPEVRDYFKVNKEILSIFDNLTPGYQRGWARYVFSTKNPETTQKRFAEMENILQLGFKSIDLFRQSK